MLTTGELRIQGDIILDIDEDFFGVEKIEPIFTKASEKRMSRSFSSENLVFQKKLKHCIAIAMA